MLFDVTGRRLAAIIIGLLNRDQLATVKLTQHFGVKISERQSEILRGKHAVGQLELAKDEESIKAFDPRATEQSRVVMEIVRAVDSWRGYSIDNLHRELSPLLWRCRTCGKYFLAKDQRSRKLCSPECQDANRRTTAAAAVRKSFAEKRRTDLDRVRKVLAHCDYRDGWKRRVALRAGVTPNFITYAIRLGELEVIPFRRK